MSATLHCPLCGGDTVSDYHRDRNRSYLQCDGCALVFVPPEYHLGAAAEKAEYDLHENHVDDPGYRRFLARLQQPLSARLVPGAEGLDFGCGPGPALAAMMHESGFAMALYDCFYYPDRIVLNRQYDFVCATEVVEHLHQPGIELDRLWGCLKTGGHFGVMTKLVRDVRAFAGWHYKNDPTHVCFFSIETWQWWAQQRGAGLALEGADVILLHKTSTDHALDL